MIVGGIDIGSLTAKSVILQDGQMHYAIQPTGIDMAKVAEEVVNAALDKAGLSFSDVGSFVATGYGRINIPFAKRQVTEITCNARGVHHFYPSARAIVDIGGQDTKVIKLDESGHVVNFAMNDKCAAGTGKFLEVAAETMGVSVEELASISARSRNKVKISSVCTVFAQTEIVSLISKKVSREDIIAGLHESVATRVFGLLCSISPEGECVMTGGVAKNMGVVRALEGKIGQKLLVPKEPQILTAFGAALMN